MLIDHIRCRNAAKRGGGNHRITLTDSVAMTESGELDSAEVHEAIEALARVDARAARVVELRFFGGLSAAQIAKINGVSERTVTTDWRYAQAWLRDYLGGTRPR